MIENNKEKKETEELKADTDSFKVSKKPTKVFRSREWMLTIKADGLPLEALKKKLEGYTWVGQLEKGKQSTDKNSQGYLHYQIAIFGKNAIRNTTIWALFPTAHREPRRYSKKKCYDYVTKDDTRVDGPFFGGDWSDKDLILMETKRNDLVSLRDAIQDGMTPDEIYSDDDLSIKASHCMSWLQKIYDAKIFAKYAKDDRDITAEYVYGKPGTGKTRYAMSGDRANTYMATLASDANKSSWSHAFDNYNGQSTLVIDDFYWYSLPFEYLLHITDRYPLQLDARYTNRYACWTKVIITSNLSLTEQYPDITSVQRAALERRITKVIHL